MPVPPFGGAYQQWAKQFRMTAAYTELKTGKNAKDIGKALFVKWKALSSAEKAPYQVIFDRLLADFKRSKKLFKRGIIETEF